jgi:hypothetical protein
MMRKFCWGIWMICMAFSVFSCVNLKGVREFSMTSLDGIRGFEQLDYTFSDHCTSRCEDEAIRKYEIKRSLECPCDVYLKADSVTLLMYQTIAGYFVGLGSLSQNELTGYSTDAMLVAMTAEELGPLQIDQNLATAYSAISNLLLRSSTDFYRRRKIAAYIEEANEPLQVLLDKFGQIVRTNLKGELRFKKERMYAFHMDMKMNNTLQSDFEKGSAAANYYRALAEVQRLERRMDLFANTLDEIAKGHQVLYDRRDKLSVKELALAMLEYSGHVQKTISEFNQFKR